jgi:hypothetical protein
MISAASAPPVLDLWLRGRKGCEDTHAEKTGERMKT